MDHDDLLRQFVAERGELLGYLRCLVPGQLVEDVFQEVFLVVVKRAAEFDRSRDFSAWVRGIARKVAHKVRAKQSCAPTLPDDVVDLVSVAYDEARASASDERDDLRHLSVCLDRLAEAQRELLRRRYHDGLSLERLAAMTGRSAGAVQVALSRLRSVLSECITHQRRVEA